LWFANPNWTDTSPNDGAGSDGGRNAGREVGESITGDIGERGPALDVVIGEVVAEGDVDGTYWTGRGKLAHWEAYTM
jgi:hypothetical protein